MSEFVIDKLITAKTVKHMGRYDAKNQKSDENVYFASSHHGHCQGTAMVIRES